MQASSAPALSRNPEFRALIGCCLVAMETTGHTRSQEYRFPATNSLLNKAFEQQKTFLNSAIIETVCIFLRIRLIFCQLKTEYQ